jgi:hypothetical protein
MLKFFMVVVMEDNEGTLVVNVQGARQVRLSNGNVGVHAHMRCYSHLCHVTPPAAM